MENTQSRNLSLTSNEQLVSRIVRKFLLPSIFSLVGTRISALIDSIIIGNMLGSTGLGAMSLISPVNLVFLSIGSLIGVGSAVVSSIAQGAGKKERSNQVFTLSFIMAAVLGILIVAGAFVGLDSLASFLGATENNIAYVKDYLSFYLIGGVFTLMLYIPLNFLRIYGRPNVSMSMLLLMSTLNIMFSLLFVMFFDMGVSGVALGTCISTSVTFFYGMWQLLKGDSHPSFCKPENIGFALLQTVVTGSPSALNNVSRAVQGIYINLLFVNSGQNEYLASYSLVNTVSNMLLAIILGVSQTILPVVGYSYGEKDYRTVITAMKKAAVTGNILVGIAGILVVIFRNTAGLIFGITDGFTLESTGIALLFLAASMNLSLINNLMANYFNATKRPIIANLIVVCRLVIFMLIPSYLLFGVIGQYAVWASLVITEILTLLFTFIATSIISKKDKQLMKYWLLDTTVMNNKKYIDFSVENTHNAAAEASEKITVFCEENEILPNKAMAISLTTEEILVLINEKALKGKTGEFSDIRLVCTDESIMFRFRYAGKPFNPIKYSKQNDEDIFGAAMGIAMIQKLSKNITYSKTFGINNLLIEL